MEIFALEGKRITSEESFHAEIASTLKFPPCYGKTLDALWDYLTTWSLDFKNDPVTFEWHDHLTSKKFLGDTVFNDILAQFNKLKKYRREELVINLY